MEKAQRCPVHVVVEMVRVVASEPVRRDTRHKSPFSTRFGKHRLILRCPVTGCPRVSMLPEDDFLDEGEAGRCYGAHLSENRWREALDEE